MTWAEVANTVVIERGKGITTVTGATNDYAISANVVSFNPFHDLTNNDYTFYTVYDDTDFEVVRGRWISANTTLLRETIYDSSNAGSAVNWGAGEKTVIQALPALAWANTVTLLNQLDTDAIRADSTVTWTGQHTHQAQVNVGDNLLIRPIIKDYGETVNIIGSIGGGTQDIDLTLGNVVTATVDTSTTTFTFSNPTASSNACSFTLLLTNGGSQTVNWPTSVNWNGGNAPGLTASGLDALTFVTVNGGTDWQGFVSALDLK